jgi:hypothetical protein
VLRGCAGRICSIAGLRFASRLVVFVSHSGSFTHGTDRRPVVSVRFKRCIGGPPPVAIRAAVRIVMLARIDFYYHPRILSGRFISVGTPADAYGSFLFFSAFFFPLP